MPSAASRHLIGSLMMAAAAVVAMWAYLGSPVAMPEAPLAPGDKLGCVSYAPFRDDQSPLDGAITIPPSQIDEDLGRLAQITRCVRTYSVDSGLDKVADIARRHGLRVIQGLWLSSNGAKNRYQIDTAIAVANTYRDVIDAVVVGNEVLLRGEISSDDLAGIVREVKAKVPVPVTYADVWEFWLRYPKLYDAVDFVTIHILPYWEDDPVPARQAAAHVEAIRKRVATVYPGKEILIGEVGWPSAGRMREGALPSPAHEALVVQDVLALAKRENYRVNIIEAFDQPWKRRLEGTVGGHWGLLDNGARQPKFIWGQPVSNHPHWPLQALFGVGFVGLVFAAAWCARSRETSVRRPDWMAVGAMAASGGAFVGWAIENALFESLGIGGWSRSLAMCFCAVAAAPLAAAMLTSREPIPSFAALLARPGRPQPVVKLAYGVVFIATTALAIQIALGLVFDPRYRDFPFAPMTAAIVPILVHGIAIAGRGFRGIAERVAAVILGLSVVYIVPNEGFANWQSLWLCGTFLALALTLVRVRGAPD